MLQVMRRYIRTFFGCKECGRHFEQAAAANMDQVTSREDEILWLWNQHNRVNTRLAGGPGRGGAMRGGAGEGGATELTETQCFSQLSG